LGELLERHGERLDAVIELEVDDEALIDRITGRYTCASCGAVYHDRSRPPKVAGVCDECGGTEFKRRADDNEESLRQRLLEYYKKTAPLIGYYYAKGLLHRVDGLAPIDEVAARIAAILDRIEAREAV
ncbi:MAG: adenylate kinase, partial [Alphaproteobacteria bacterium]